MNEGPPPLVALGVYFAILAAQRAHELLLSARHERALRSRGAIEHGRGHYPLIVALHAVFPVALAVEVIWGGARPPSLWPLCLVALAAAALLRLSSMRALGEFWTTRVLVVPDAPYIRLGPYRWFAHPSYAAAAIELAAAPLMFGAWRTAVALAVLNAPLLAARVASEKRAWHSPASPDSTRGHGLAG